MQIRKRIIASAAIVGLSLASIGVATVATAQPQQTNTQRIAILETQVVTHGAQIATLNAEVFLPALPGKKTPTVAPTLTPVVTATVAPTATAPVVTPAATATTMPGMTTGVCGESLMVWHAPVINGCATGHEHGDAPPAWVLASANPPSFDHAHGTSAIENAAKHPFMKGYAWTDSFKQCIRGYVSQHGAGMGMERQSRFHSTRWWVQDCSGKVSYGSFWSDFGVPALYPAGDRVMPEDFDRVHNERQNQGIIRLPTPQNGAEQWYAAVYGCKPDISVLIINAVEFFNMDEINNPQGEFNSANWQLSGQTGNSRQLDFVWPEDRIACALGSYQTDQFAQPVTDAQCATGGSAEYDGAVYPLQCARWVVQPSLLADVRSKQPEFGIRRVFALARNENHPDTGVHAPN